MLNRKKAKAGNALEKGFTLVELLIVVVILGVLSGIALPAFLNQQKLAKANAANTEVMQAARSCAALQITDQQDDHDPGNATGGSGCKASGTESTFTVDATADHTVATATVSADGGVTQTAKATVIGGGGDGDG